MTQTDIFGGTKPEPVKVDIPYTNSMLKSAMQKRIRRGDVDEALRLAKSLMYKDPMDFARRVFVVVPEESWVHPYLAKMPEIIQRLSKKDAVLTEDDKTVMLSMIRDAAACETRDFYIKNPDDRPFEPERMSHLSDKERELVQAIMYRKSIGGMRPDIIMMESLINIWVNRFSDKVYDIPGFVDIFETLTGELVDDSKIDFATDDDFPYYAIDFHCAPFISGMLLDRKRSNSPDDFERNELKQFIDQNIDHSKLTPRKDKGDTYDEAIYKVMWLYEVSRNTKINHWTNRTVDWYTDGPFDEPSEMREAFDQLNELLKPKWEGAAKWYVRVQHQPKK